MKKRDCEHCANHTPDGCSSWECEFRPAGADLICRQTQTIEPSDNTPTKNTNTSTNTPTVFIDGIGHFPKLPNKQRINIEPSGDLISRQSINNNRVHLCNSCKHKYPKCQAETEDVLFGDGVGSDNICCCAKYIPSAEKTGKWVEDGCIEKCKDCGEQKHFPHWRFCPNCGARMVGDKYDCD